MALKDIWVDKRNGIDTADATDLNNVAHAVISLEENPPEIPTKVSQLENDSGYLTEHQDISGKADVDSVYTKAEVDSSLAEKADKATTLDGYGITDSYTKTEVDTKIGDIDTALDSIIAEQEAIISMQQSLIGGETT